MTKRKFITALIFLAVGFGIGWTSRPLFIEEDTRIKNKVTKVQDVPARGMEKGPAPTLPPSTTTSPSGGNLKRKSTDNVTIPLRMIDSSMPPLFSGGDMELLGVMLLTYNLPSDRFKLLLTGVRDVFAKMQAAEAAHSKLVTGSNGDQYFVVESFAGEGAELQNRLQSILTESFEGIEDDRREVFQRQLDSSQLFSDFGKTAKEISIDESPGADGKPRYTLAIRPHDKSGMAELFQTTTVPLTSTYMRNRYGSLIDKHIKQQPQEK